MPEPVHNNPVSPQIPEQPPEAKIIPFPKPQDTTAAVEPAPESSQAEELPDIKDLEQLLPVAQELDPQNAKVYSELVSQKGDILKNFEKRGQEMRADPNANDQQKVNGYEFEIAALQGRFYQLAQKGKTKETEGIWQKIESLRREQGEIIAKNKDVQEPQLSEFAKNIGVAEDLAAAAPLAGIQETVTQAIKNPEQRQELVNHLKENGFDDEQIGNFEKFARHEKVRSLGKKGLIGAGLAGLIMLVFGWMAIKRAQSGLQPRAAAA